MEKREQLLDRGQTKRPEAAPHFVRKNAGGMKSAGLTGNRCGA